MNKFYISFVAVLLLLTGAVNALDTSFVHAYYNMSSVNDASTNSRHLTGSGMSYNTTQALIGESGEWDPGDFLNYDPGILWPTTEDFSLSVWVYPDNAAGDTRQIIFGGVSGAACDDGLTFALRSNGTLFVEEGCNPQDFPNALFSFNTWTHLVMVYNKTGSTSKLDLYINGIYNDTITNMGGYGDFIYATDAGVPNDDRLGVTRGAATNQQFEGYMDEISIWNISLTSDNVTELYNSGSGCAWPLDSCAAGGGGDPGDTLNITNTTPADSNSFNAQNFSINATISSESNFNITLYLNNVTNQTFTNVASGSNVLVQVNFTFPADHEANYNYSFSAINQNGTEENTTEKTFWIDNVQPNIGWIFPASSNDSVVAGNVSANITIYDPNLYSYEYNITQLDGTVIYNSSNSSLTGTVNISITDSVSVSNYGEVLQAKLLVCDGHTAQYIDWESNLVSNKELIFDSTRQKVKIYQENKADTQSASSSHNIDRYNFNFRTVSNAAVQNFVVESDNFIDILDGKTEYAGHLVTGNKWVDFEIDNLDNVRIVRIGDKKVRVIVTLKSPTRDWNFHSTGELNCITETTLFYSVNTTENYNLQAITSDSETFDLNVSYNGTYITSAISAILYYNNTAYSVTGTNVSTAYTFSKSITTPSTAGNYSFYWTYTVNGQAYNTTAITQEVIDFDVDACTVYTTPFLNFTVRDEETNALINAEIETVITYSSSANTKTFNTSHTNTSNFAYCFTPSYANLTGSLNILYTASAYEDRSYIDSAAIFDNIEDSITLYILNSSSGTDITIHVIDSADNDLPGIVIKAYKYDIATDTDVLVQIETTDSDGNLVFNLVTGSNEYSFEFYQDGVLVLSTSRFKLFSTSYEYVIGTTEVSRLSELRSIKNSLTSSLIYSNASKLVNFSWVYTGSDVSSFCLNISTSNESFYSSCSTSTASGSLSYTISTFNISYSAIATAVSVNNYDYTLHTLFIDTREGWSKFGKDNGLTFAFLILLTLVFLSLAARSPTITTVSVGVGVYIISWFGILPLSRGAGVGALLLSVVIAMVINRRSGP